VSLDEIISELADQADDFLAGVTDRAQARAAIAEQINLDYFTLNPADRTTVTNGVMAALEAEEFFGMEFFGDPFQDDPETDD
jgi:aspartate/methionine/tyrosine aminotransferase